MKRKSPRYSCPCYFICFFFTPICPNTLSLWKLSGALCISWPRGLSVGVVFLSHPVFLHVPHSHDELAPLSERTQLINEAVKTQIPDLILSAVSFEAQTSQKKGQTGRQTALLATFNTVATISLKRVCSAGCFRTSSPVPKRYVNVHVKGTALSCY